MCIVICELSARGSSATQHLFNLLSSLYSVILYIIFLLLFVCVPVLSKHNNWYHHIHGNPNSKMTMSFIPHHVKTKKNNAITTGILFFVLTSSKCNKK